MKKPNGGPWKEAQALEKKQALSDLRSIKASAGECISEPHGGEDPRRHLTPNMRQSPTFLRTSLGLLRCQNNLIRLEKLIKFEILFYIDSIFNRLKEEHYVSVTANQKF
jgi:hypothetical protein